MVITVCPAGGSPCTGVLGGQKVSRTSVLGTSQSWITTQWLLQSSRWQSSYRGAGWSKGKQDQCVRYLTELDHNPVVITVCPAGGSPCTGVLGGQKVSRTSVLGTSQSWITTQWLLQSSRWQSSYRGAGWSKGKQDPCVRYLTELDHNPVVITVCPAGGSPRTGVLGGQKVSRTSVLGTSQSWITTQWLLRSVQQVAVLVQGCWVVKR